MKKVLQDTGNQLFAAILLSLLGATASFAQTFPTPTGFTLPNGKTIVITYEVDVKPDACPTGTVPVANISNQSNVSGTNFATVQTDDPDIAGSPGPTLTPFGALSLGNLVYKDNNRNGVFDAGDTGINGVLVNLYLDDGDGVLDAGDGAALTTATTAGGGLYLFPAVCPGNYIVEVAASNFNPGGPLYDNGLMTALVSSPVGGAADPDNDVNNDDNGDPVAGFGVASAAITLAYGAEPINDGDTDPSTNLSVDFGFKTPTSVSIGDVTMTEGTGGSTTSFTFTVTRNDNSEAFSLTVNTMDGTATVADNDFAAISGGTVSFTAGGSTTATITVLVNHDNTVETNENFTVLLSGAPGGVIISDGSGLGTITNDDAAVVTLTSISATQNEGNSGTTDFYFRATLNNPVQGGFTIAYANNDGTATLADGDYNNNDGTITFAGTAGEQHDIAVQVNGDLKVELTETFTVTLGTITGGPGGITTAGSPQTGTITNDDAATISIAALSQNEGNAGTTNYTFTATLSNAVDAAVSVGYATSDGTALDMGAGNGSNDYNAASGTLNFTGTAGETKTFIVPVNADVVVELTETFNAVLSSLSAGGRNVVFAGGGATESTTGTIVNDDQCVLSFANTPFSAPEGNSGNNTYQLFINRSNPVDINPLVLLNHTDGTATLANNDYVLTTFSFNLSNGSGVTNTFVPAIVGDTRVEADETMTLTVTENNFQGRNVVFLGGGPSINTTVTIVNDEVDWGDGPDTLPTTLIMNGARHNTVLGFQLGATIDGDADGQPGLLANGDDTDADGDDEDGVTLPGVFVTGTTATITVNASQPGKLDAFMDFNWNRNLGDAGEKIFNNVALVAGDNVLTFAVPAGATVGSSFMRFRFSSAGGLSNSGLAADGEVEDYRTNIVSNQLSINSPSVAEGNAGTTNLVYTVSRTTNTNASSVDYAITGGSATSGTDYMPLASGTINFPAGGALTQTVTVTVNGDVVVEDNETIIITLSNPVNGGIGSGTGTGTITNDDAANLTLSGGIAQNETNAGTVSYTFTATLSAAVQDGFQVPYTTDNGTATTADNDYQDNDGTLTFTGTVGETKTITVLVNGDTKVELNETFTVALGTITATSAVQIAAITKVGSPQTGTVTNDEQATISIAPVSQNEGNAGTTNYTFTATLSNAVDAVVSMTYGTSDGTALDMGSGNGSNDYNAVSGTLIFTGTANETKTFVVPVNADVVVELTETFNAILSGLTAGGRNVIFAGGGATATVTGTIVNDDQCVLSLANTPYSAPEGNSGNNPYTISINISNPVDIEPLVQLNHTDGTATLADNDYVPSITFNISNNSGVVSTPVPALVGDTRVEANETMTLTVTENSFQGRNIVFLGGGPSISSMVTIINDEVDWGDGPDTLPTQLIMNGARHNTVLGLRLGATIDGDADGQPGLLANGDDTDADGDDEDGVTLPGVFVRGTTATITVNASAAGKLDAFMDFNWNRNLGDGGEKIFNSVALVAGDNVLTFAVPGGAVVGSSYIRFRFSSAGGLSNSGLANDGEVEDYRTMIVNNQFSIDNPSVVEGNAGTTNLVFTVTRTSNSIASSVGYAITGGTATSGSDYVPLPGGTLNFGAGGALSQTVTVTVNGDLAVEDNETVIITLSNPVNGGLGASPGTGTITNDDAATLTLSGGATLNETNAGTVAHTFTATLSAAVQGGFTVAYTTDNGTATAGSDYADNDGTLTFTGTAGETKTITVQANGDNTVELTETFTENLGAIGATTAVQAAAITPGGSPQTATIVNDDSAIITINSVSQSEAAGPQGFTVTLSNRVDVDVAMPRSSSDGTATAADNDYLQGNSGTFGIPAGQLTSSFAILVNDDSKVEANEVFNVTLSALNAMGRAVTFSGGGATLVTTGTILNDDAATVTLTPAGGITQNEGNTSTVLYQFFATLNNPVQGSFTVNYTSDDGTANAGSDYINNDGIVSFSGIAGQSQPISILVNGDFFVEADETFTVALGAINGAPAGVTTAGSPQTGTILNDEVDYGDAPDTYATLLASNGARHNANVTLRLGAALDGDADGQSNAAATGDDTDAEGDDEDGVTLPAVIVTTTTVNITVNASATGKLDGWVDFNANGSFGDAGEKVFNNVALVAGNNALSFVVPAGATPSNSYARFRFSTLGGLSFNGSAADGEVEDYAVQIVNTQFSIDDPTVSEGNAGTANLVFTVSRTINANACSVDYAITGGTATTADNDYQPLTAGTLSFAAGGPLTQTVTVVVNGDVKVELNETVLMTLSNPVNASILDGSGTGTITNDDAAVITITSPSITEGDGGASTLTFTLNMSNPSDANVGVNYTTVDGTATTANNDYLLASGSHTFAPGEQTQTVAVTINGDCAIEPNETFFLRLSALSNNGRNVTLNGGGATLDGTGTINNDDALPVISCPGNLTVNAAPGVCNATVTLTLPTTGSLCGSSALEFHYRTVDGAGNPTGAYNAFAPSNGNTVNFPVGRYEVEWRITDGSGSSSCSLFLTVVDNQPPVANCTPIFNLTLNGAGNGPVTPANLNNGSTDNCGITTQSVNPSLFTCANVGPNTSTLTLGDAAGNTAQCVSVVNVFASAFCTPPAISNAGGPNIADPCTCLGNGRFGEEVVIGPTNAGQQWRVQATTLINPATNLPFATNTLFTEIPVGGGQSIYVLSGVHLDGVGYTLTAVSFFWPGVVLSISNTCYYPDPVIDGPDGPFCLSSNDATYTGSAGGVGGTGQFYLNGVPIPTVESPAGSGNWVATLNFSALGVGSYTLVFEFDAGNPAGLLPPPNVGCIASVTEFVTVLPTPAQLICNNLLYVSLDIDCVNEVLPDDVLEGTYGCYDDYIVEIDRTAPYGNGPWTPNVLGVPDVGNTYQYRVTHLISGNKCWGNIKLEDKLSPTIECEDIFLTCANTTYDPAYLENVLNIPAGIPDAFDCTGTTLIYIDTWHDLSCNEGFNGVPDLSAYVLRKWTVTDGWGNTATCNQFLYFERLHIGDVLFPADVTISCTDNINTSPANTGAPYFYDSDNFITYPLFPNATWCELQAAYVDQVLPVCDGTYKILRTWTVIDWCLPTTPFPPTSNPMYYVQLIKIIDDQGPVFTCPANLTVSTDPFNCCATTNLPDVLITDNCSRVNSISAMVITFDPYNGDQTGMYTVGGILTTFPGNNFWDRDTLGNWGITPCLPVGRHTVIYTATDDCGNTSTCSFRLTVADFIPPVPACDEFTVVAIGIDDPLDCYNPADGCDGAGVTWVSAQTFDDGSYDNCSNIYLTVRRMEPYSDCVQNLEDCEYPLATEENDSIKFYCCEVGTTQTVILRVYQVDFDGNFINGLDGDPVYNECMVQVEVQDKIKPVCMPPANVTVSCENFDPSLWVYGKATIVDNCCLDTSKVYQGQCGMEHSANYNLFDTVCNRGTIVRTFRAFDCHGQSSQCTQRIIVNYEQDYFVKFPNDVIVTVCDGTGVYGEPVIFGEDCELIGVNYVDQIFTVVPDACFKIERTWTIINWCTYNPNLPCIEVPNPNPNATTNHTSNLPGPTVSACGTLPPWNPTIVKINPSDPTTTNYCTFYDANANCYKYKQIIKVIDTQDPVVDCPASPVTFCDLTPNNALLWNEMYWWDNVIGSHDLCEGPTDLCITATDACSGFNMNIKYLLFLDLDGDGVMETVINSVNTGISGLGWNAVPFGNAGNPNFAGGTIRQFDERPVPANQKWGFAIQTTTSGTSKTACVRWNTQQQQNTYVIPELPYGTHKIKWFVEDGCGNETVCEYTFIVKDCKKPTVVCLNGLSVNIMPTGMITLWASDFLQYTEDNCTPANLLKIGIRKSGTGTGFPLDGNGQPITSVTFTCDELGTQLVELWSIDLAGNADFCETYVIVQDNMGNCPDDPNSPNAKVAGVLAMDTPANDGVEDGSVGIQGSGPGIPTYNFTTMSNNAGAYGFNAIPTSSNSTVTPTKDDNPLNGVTTYDLVLISKHILGLEPMNSPYKMIAADANNNGSVTAFDIVEIRKLILGIYQDLPNNTSWRFIDNSFVFTNPNNPFIDVLPENKTITNIQSNKLNEDFVSIKIGDVNNTAIANSLMSVDDRSASTLLFDVEDRLVKAGETFTVNFKAAERVQGYQFTMNFKGLEVSDITPGTNMKAENFGVFADAITTSFDGAAQGEFAVTFRAVNPGKISDMIGVSSRITKAEAYSNTNDKMDVAFRFNGASGATVSGVGFELYQNQPNPFVNKTFIGFNLPVAAEATLTIFDETGRMVYTQKGDFAKGYNAIAVDRALLNATGMLYYKVETATDSATKKMIQAK